MADIRLIEPGKYNKLLAKALKDVEEIQRPQWTLFVKSGVNKVRPSIEEDFWHKRTASILRQLYVRGLVGVQRLRTRYGGRKKRGSPPAEFRRGGGKIIRTILQQAEAAGFVEKVKDKKSGRKLTEKGKNFLEAAAE